MKYPAGLLLLALAASRRRGADGFSLRMASDLPPPFRPMAASPSPQSALHYAPPAASAAVPVIETRAPKSRTKPRNLGLLTFDVSS